MNFKHIEKAALRYLMAQDNHPPIILLALKRAKRLSMLQLEINPGSLKEQANHLFLAGASFATHAPTAPIRKIWFVNQAQLDPVGEVLHIMEVKTPQQ
jgi:hypothetical protein